MGLIMRFSHPTSCDGGDLSGGAQSLDRHRFGGDAIRIATDHGIEEGTGIPILLGVKWVDDNILDVDKWASCKNWNDLRRLHAFYHQQLRRWSAQTIHMAISLQRVRVQRLQGALSTRG